MRTIDARRPWLTGQFKGEYIGYSNPGPMRKQQIFTLSIVRGTITNLRMYSDQPTLDSSDTPLKLQLVKEIYATEESIHNRVSLQNIEWGLLQNLYQVSIYQYEVTPKFYDKEKNTMHGTITGTIVANIYKPSISSTPNPIASTSETEPSVDPDNPTEEPRIEEPNDHPDVDNHPINGDATPNPEMHPNSDGFEQDGKSKAHPKSGVENNTNIKRATSPIIKKKLKEMGALPNSPAMVRKLVLATMLTMNNVNLDVMSIFNLHFFTVSIQDLPSSETDFADTDEDGILDSLDECPLIPEDIDGFEDNDGCPEQDNDEDGIADIYDACPNIKGYQKDGCPSVEQQGEVANIDMDNDGIPNSFDECPNEPETINNYNDYDGCPDTIPEELKELIGIQTAIQFETNTAKLTNDSTPELEKLVRLLKLYPATRIRVEGHTDTKGTAQYNQLLSEKRAEAVRTQILERGIGKNRVLAKGYSFRRPIASNDTEAGRTQNRRVEISCHACKLPNPEITPESVNFQIEDSPSENNDITEP